MRMMSVIAVHWQFAVFAEELLTVVLMELNVIVTAAGLGFEVVGKATCSGLLLCLLRSF